jgi:hypothetical protein
MQANFLIGIQLPCKPVGSVQAYLVVPRTRQCLQNRSRRDKPETSLQQANHTIFSFKTYTVSQFPRYERNISGPQHLNSSELSRSNSLRSQQRKSILPWFSGLHSSSFIHPFAADTKFYSLLRLTKKNSKLIQWLIASQLAWSTPLTSAFRKPIPV